MSAPECIFPLYTPPDDLSVPPCSNAYWEATPLMYIGSSAFLGLLSVLMFVLTLYRLNHFLSKTPERWKGLCRRLMALPGDAASSVFCACCLCRAEGGNGTARYVE